MGCAAKGPRTNQQTTTIILSCRWVTRGESRGASGKEQLRTASVAKMYTETYYICIYMYIGVCMRRALRPLCQRVLC